jgi:hypothetical protein
MLPRSRNSCIRAVAISVISCLAALVASDAQVKAAGKENVTVSIVLALAAGEWSTEILAGANAAAKDLNGKVKVRVSGPSPRHDRVLPPPLCQRGPTPASPPASDPGGVSTLPGPAERQTHNSQYHEAQRNAVADYLNGGKWTLAAEYV